MTSLPKVISREDAKQAGLTRFFSGEPCIRGHVCERGVANRRCVHCAKAMTKEWWAATRSERSRVRKEYVKNNPEKQKGWKLKTAYGIGLEEYNSMFAAQGNRCAICKTDRPGGLNWHTDHSHSSGTVRGILCYGCNIALGYAKDSIPVLKGMIAYLERNADRD